MELRHIRYFVAAAEEENFGRASERLHVTRPAISQMIADLEAELGAAVFERYPHRVRLTPAGRALLPEFQNVLKSIDEALRLARQVSQGLRGRLRIGYGHQTLMHSLFQTAVQRFRCQHPDIELDLLEVPTPDQPQALADGRIDAAFMHFGPARPLPQGQPSCQGLMAGTSHEGLALEWLPLEANRLGVAIAATHRFARRTAVMLSELAHEPFVDVARSSFSIRGGLLHRQCHASGFEPRVVQEVERLSAQLNLIAGGMGVGLAVCGASFAYPEKIRVLRLADGSHMADFVFGWCQDRATPALRQMVEVMRALRPAGIEAAAAIGTARPAS